MARCSTRTVAHVLLPLVVVCIAISDMPAGHACTTPVFRYALERWDADPYPIDIVYRGTLNEEVRAAVDLLVESAHRTTAPANVVVRRINLDEPPPDTDYTLDDLGPGDAHMVVSSPRQPREEKPFWDIPLTEDAVLQLVDSPLRQEIASRLIHGDSAVWLLLESGNKEKDDAAAMLLDEQLAVLEKTLRLPEQNPLFYGALQSTYRATNDSLKIAFSSLRLCRDDPTEAFLWASLRPPDVDEPIVFPIFGRGRALCALVGDQITERSISRAGTFLVEACTCLVKWQNRGLDLLVAADWDKTLKMSGSSEPPAFELAGVSSLLQAEDGFSSDGTSLQAAVPPDGLLDAGPLRTKVDLFLPVIITLGLATVCVIAATVSILRTRLRRGQNLESQR